jgi:uncharacterized protein (DUF1330 family)
VQHGADQRDLTAMTAYMIFQITVTDPAAYAEYAKHTPRLIAAAGGRMLVRGGDMEVVEGAAQGARAVVLEFPDRAAAKKFYHSPAYQALMGLRKPVSSANGIIVDGYASDAWAAAVTESNKHG